MPRPRDVIAANSRLSGCAKDTAILRSDSMNEKLECEIYFKCEHLQHTGSFKFRGASNAVALLSPGIAHIATQSSGNHGAALAAAGAYQGRSVHVVVPENARRVKVELIKSYGASVHFCAPNQTAREKRLAELVASGMEVISGYDNRAVIAGQGTAGMELIESVPELNILVVPVGGGGLMAGCLLAAEALQHSACIIGVEPIGADDTYKSLNQGVRIQNHEPKTVADGLVALVGLRPFAILKKRNAEIIRVSDPEIVYAMNVIWQELDQVVEPSAAAALAAIIRVRSVFANKRVGVILTGGNIEARLHKKMIIDFGHRLGAFQFSN